MTSRPRLADVAARAGVSMKTVSNVINDYPHVRPDTRDRVNDAIQQLSYRPNLSARGLRSGRTGVIGDDRLVGVLRPVGAYARVRGPLVPGWSIPCRRRP